VHRKPLPGEELGQRLGASTSTGAIQAIFGVFPVTGIGVTVALDGTLYPSDFLSASFGLAGRTRAQAWSECGVVVLDGILLELNGVNLTYCKTIEVCTRVLIPHVVLTCAYTTLMARRPKPTSTWICAIRLPRSPAHRAHVELGCAARARGRRRRGHKEAAQGHRQPRRARKPAQERQRGLGPAAWHVVAGLVLLCGDVAADARPLGDGLAQLLVLR
jgi:hypothetical protein